MFVIVTNFPYLADCNKNIINMKSKLKLFTLFLFSLFLTTGFVACSDDTDPTDQTIFVDSYKGKITYLNVGSGKKVSADDGKVIVSKLGDTYSFRFDNGIPDLTGIKFEKKDDNTFVSLGSDGLKGIKITASELHILMVKGGETWTADCKR